MSTDKEHIILFDGFCNLCQGSVAFASKRDKQNKFSFLPLQSEKVVELLKDHDVVNLDMNSVIYIHDGHLYKKSTAVLRILKDLVWPWKVFYILWIIPAPVRNFFYDIVTGLRYRLFGRRHSCEIPYPLEP